MPNTVKLVLRRSVEDLGRIGDIVQVKVGFARNYLLPQRLAMEVTQQNLARLEKEKQALLEEEAARKASLEALAERAKQIPVTITAQATPDGTLYGSVNARIIADYFRDHGVPIEARAVLLSEPIKEVGVHVVVVHLGPEVEFETKVWVVDETGSTGEDADEDEASGEAEESADQELEAEV